MIIRDDQIGSLNLTTPKVVVIEITPSPFARAASTNVVGWVLQCNRGDAGKIYTIGDMPEASRKIGFYDPNLDGIRTLKNFFTANGSLAKVSIAADTTGRTAATGTIKTNATGSVLFTLEANTTGDWGNYIEATPSAASVDDYFNITIRNKKTQESVTYIKVTTDDTDARYIKTLIDKDPKKFFTIEMTNTDGTMPDLTTVRTLSGGSNGEDQGDALADAAYIGTEVDQARTGIQLFKSQEADDVILVCSARNNDAINTALITHVSDINLTPRRTILTFEEGTVVSDAIDAMATMDNDKVKIVYPRTEITDEYTGLPLMVNPVAFDAANDTLLGYHQSASQTRYPDIVKRLEVDLSNSDINSLTAKRINPIVLRPGVGFIRASDYTTSSNPALAQNTVRKAKDFFGRTFYTLLQNYISKPITPKLWKAIKDALEAFLRTEAREERIGNTSGGAAFGVKVDKDNNPQEVVVESKVIVEVEISLLAAADIIMLYLDSSQDKTITNV